MRKPRYATSISLNEEQKKILDEFLVNHKVSIVDIFMAGVEYLKNKS